MTVFKGYMIIIKRNLAFLFLYGGIFFSIMMGVQGAATKTDTAVYEKTNLNIAVIDEDGSAFSKGMAEALDKEHTIITDVTEQRDLAEELYYWRVDYVLRIPENAEALLLDGDAALEVVKGVSSDGAYRSVYADMQVDSYVNAYRVYRNAGMDMEEAVEQALQVAGKQAEIRVRKSAEHNDKGILYHFYFRYLPFVLLYTFCYIFPLVLKNFNRREMERRMNSSGIPSLWQNLQGSLALFLFCGGLYLLLMLLAVVLYRGDLLQDVNLGYYLLNAACLTLVSASISYLIGTCVKNELAVNGIANIVALGMSFLCGVLVDMELLGSGVRMVAQFLPVYWYETANITLYEFGSMTMEQRNSVWLSIGIQLAMAVSILCIALIIKKKRVKEA